MLIAFKEKSIILNVPVYYNDKCYQISLTLSSFYDLLDLDLTALPEDLQAVDKRLIIEEKIRAWVNEKRLDEDLVISF